MKIAKKAGKKVFFKENWIQVRNNTKKWMEKGYNKETEPPV